MVLPQLAGTRLIPLGEPTSPTPVLPSASPAPTRGVLPPPPATHTRPPPGPMTPRRPTATRVPVGGGITHTVEAGETVGKLAVCFGSTIEAIAEASGLEDPGRIAVGQILTIPILTSPSEAP